MILALKTDSAITTKLWLLSPDAKPAATLSWESGRRLSDEVLTHLTDFLRAHKVEFSDLSGLLVFSGPGSFTSLRIGHTVANALADSFSIPVIGAQGDNWLSEGCHKLAHAKLGQPALPSYGSKAHITRPTLPNA